MIHLLAQLLRDHDAWFVTLVIGEAILGGATAAGLLVLPWFRRCRPLGQFAQFGLAVTLTSWLSFLTALAGTYPRLSLVVPPAWALPSMALSFVSAMAAAAIQKRGRRSARNTMLAGSLLACGFSCMLFTGLAGIVRPFALSYDLTAVLIVMVLGAALFGFALWEGNSLSGRRSWAVGSGLIALGILVLDFGSLAAVLPFEGWIEALNQPDDLASSPVAIIVAAEAVAVLALSLFGSLVDNRVAARDRLEVDRLRQLADSTFEGILIHSDGEILNANESLSTLLGLPLAELRASPVTQFFAQNAHILLWNPERGAMPVETEIVAFDGTRLPVEILSRSIVYGGRTALVTALRDVRERRASEKRIRFLAHHDMLTELPNRALLHERLDMALHLASRARTPLNVLCLDLDGFKAVNDTLGHAAGDQLLRQVADRLRAHVRESDFIARIGGDEFIVLQAGGHEPEQAAALARRIIECLTTTFHLDGEDVNVGISIGIAAYPQDGDTAEILLKRGDIALYRAKENGRGWFCPFEDGMDSVLRERRELEQDLRNALQTNELTLSFQPMFDSSRELVAFEALARWTHPTRGPMSPAHFINLAEESGLIIPLGEWVIRTACAAAASWNSDCRVAVNLSPAQFLRGNLSNLISTVLKETGLPAHRLELEITESVLIANTDDALRLLSDLRDLGTRLVLDDFGTGYSSLSYLQRFPFDKLKVDRSFVQQLGGDAGSDAIVSAIIAMSRNLNLEVTAEGVETDEQFQMLCAQGCDELQGFLLGRPMPQETIGAYLRDRARPSRAAHPGLADHGLPALGPPRLGPPRLGLPRLGLPNPGLPLAFPGLDRPEQDTVAAAWTAERAVVLLRGSEAERLVGPSWQ